MQNIPFFPLSSPRQTAVQRATAAIGLSCALIGGACWAQAAPEQAAPSTAAVAGKAEKTGQSEKIDGAEKSAVQDGKSSKSSKKTTHKTTASSKQGKNGAHGKTDAKSTDKSAEKASDKASDKPADKVADAKSADGKSSELKTADVKVSEKASDKSAEKTSEKASDKPADKPATPVLAQTKTDAVPPAGTMMGAYGQSLMRANGATTVAAAPSPAPQGMALSAAPTVATLAAVTTAPSPSTANALPPTAMMGAAGVAAGDSVSRFLQQRGIVAQAQAQTQAENAGLLNQVRDKASDLVMSAMNFLGVPYRRGGNSVSNGFDCSGFTRHIFEMSVGLVLPRRADEQAKLSSLVSIKKEDLKPGDLVFFNTMRATFSHVGIYVGEGKFIHSPRVGGAVRVEDMREAYWAKRFTGARRADLAAQATPGT